MAPSTSTSSMPAFIRTLAPRSAAACQRDGVTPTGATTRASRTTTTPPAQVELRQAAKTDHLIDQSLKVLPAKVPGSARAQARRDPQRRHGITGVGMLRFDVTNGAAVPGRAVGEPMQNLPLSAWNEYLSTLLAGRCDWRRTADVVSASERDRLEKFGAALRLVCPVTDVEGRLLGGVFITWDTSDASPDPERRPEIVEEAKKIGAQIASVLTLRMSQVVYRPAQAGE